VLTFEPHPRDYFAAVTGKPRGAGAHRHAARQAADLASAASTRRGAALQRRLGRAVTAGFIDEVLVQGLGVKYVLVGDDFRFGAGARATTPCSTPPAAQGFDVARMNSYEVHGLRVSSSAVREALARAAWPTRAPAGRPYSISGHVVHGRKLGRELGFPHAEPALCALEAGGQRHLRRAGAWPGRQPLPGVANLGVRPSLDPDDVNGGRVLLETHCLDWPAAWAPKHGYGKIIRVELLHKLHDELKYDGLEALSAASPGTATTRAYFASGRRPCDRI
jgi:riboflavin kinase/FMN adenylyltransferase